MRGSLLTHGKKMSYLSFVSLRNHSSKNIKTRSYDRHNIYQQLCNVKLTIHNQIVQLSLDTSDYVVQALLPDWVQTKWTASVKPVLVKLEEIVQPVLKPKSRN